MAVSSPQDEFRAMRSAEFEGRIMLAANVDTHSWHSNRKERVSKIGFIVSECDIRTGQKFKRKSKTYIPLPNECRSSPVLWISHEAPVARTVFGEAQPRAHRFRESRICFNDYHIKFQ